jgi:hypothetical protein
LSRKKIIVNLPRQTFEEMAIITKPETLNISGHIYKELKRVLKKTRLKQLHQTVMPNVNQHASIRKNRLRRQTNLSAITFLIQKKRFR